MNEQVCRTWETLLRCLSTRRRRAKRVNVTPHGGMTGAIRVSRTNGMRATHTRTDRQTDMYTSRLMACNSAVETMAMFTLAVNR